MTPSSDLVRDRTAVNALIAEVAGNAIADANVSQTAKVEKKIVRDRLKGEGAPAGRRLPAALMAFPVGGYDLNKTLQNAKDWEALKPLFTGE